MSNVRTFDRWVRDPLFSPVKRFLEKRKALINDKGDIVDRQLAEFRYDGMSVNDFIIENVLTGPDDVKRICLTNKAKHFARVDMELEPVTLRQCLQDVGVPIYTVLTHEAFVEGFKNGVVQNEVLYLAWRDSLAVCLGNRKAKTLEGTNELFQNTFFEKMKLTRETEQYIDKKTLISGTVEVTDQAIGSERVFVYVNELVSAELGIVDMQHNYPKVITSQRGQSVRHAVKIFSGGEDITARATVTYTSKNNYVNVRPSTNKLEMLVDVIRGSAEVDMEDTISVSIKYTEGLTLIDAKVDITVKIQKDTASRLKLTGYPVSINTPDNVELYVVVKATLDGAPVVPNVVPSGLTAMVYNVALNSQGAADGGNAFSGRCNLGVNAGTRYDLLQGTFRYTADGITHSATAFIDLTVNIPTADYGKLVQVKLNPVKLTGKPGNKQTFDYQVSRLGSILDNTKIKFPVNKPLGPKKLIRFTSTLAAKVEYEFLQDVGAPGSLVSDVVPFEPVYVDDNAVVWRVTSTVQPEVLTPSEILFELLSPGPITASRYDEGVLPFTVKVNGELQTQNYTLLGVTSTNDLVRIHLDGYVRNKRAWMYLGRSAVDVPNAMVEFRGSMIIDGEVKTLLYSVPFNLTKFTGPAYVSIPSEITITGEENGVIPWSAHFWNEDRRINTEVDFLRLLSTLSNKTDCVVTAKRTEVLEASQLFRGNGNWTDILAFGKPAGATKDNVAFITIKSNVLKPRGLNTTISSISFWEPYQVNTLNVIVKFNGDVVPLFSSKVKITTEFVGEDQSNYVEKDKLSTLLQYYVNREAKFTTTNIPVKVKVVYTDTDGTVYTSDMESVIDLKRPAIASLSIVPEPDPILPNTVDQRIWFKITDGKKFFGGARITGITLNPQDQFHNPLASYKPTMGVLSNDPTRYFFTATTNHLGGEFWANTTIGIGDTSFKAVSSKNFVIPHNEIVGTNVSNGSAVKDVTSTITFDLKQDQLNNPGVPVVMKSAQYLMGDQLYISAVTDLVMISPGKYSIKIVSTGVKGPAHVGFTITKADGDPGYDMEWECGIVVEMK